MPEVNRGLYTTNGPDLGRPVRTRGLGIRVFIGATNRISTGAITFSRGFRIWEFPKIEYP